LSGSHVISGAAVAASSPGSAVAIAMMVGGGRTPPFAAWLGPDWIRTRDGQPSSSVEGNFSGRRAHALP